MTKRRLLTIVRWLFLAVLLGAGIWYASAHPEFLRAVTQVSLWWLLPLAALVAVAKLLQSLQFRCLASAFQLDLHFSEWFGLTVCKSFYGYLLPGRPGTGVQAIYLKQQHEFPFAHFGSLFAATSLLDAASAALAGLLACGAHYLINDGFPALFPVTFAVIAALCAIGCVGLTFIQKASPYFPTQLLRRFVTRAAGGLQFLRSRPRILAKVMVLGIVRLVLESAALLTACFAFRVSVKLPAAIVMSALSTLGIFLPLTPGSIGVNEGIIVASARVLGLPANQILLAALLRRAVGMCLFFLLGSAFTHILTGRFIPAAGKGKTAHIDEESRAKDA